MSWAFMSRPEREGAKADPVKEAALAAKLPDYRPDSHKKPAGTTCSTASVSLPIRIQRLFAAGDQFSRLNQDQVWVACRPYAVLIILKLAERFRQHM